MKYIFAAGCLLKRTSAAHVADVYRRLCERFTDVIVYHRDCRKPPLFGGRVTLISDCPSCRAAYGALPSVTVTGLDEALARPN